MTDQLRQLIARTLGRFTEVLSRSGPAQFTRQGAHCLRPWTVPIQCLMGRLEEIPKKTDWSLQKKIVTEIARNRIACKGEWAKEDNVTVLMHTWISIS